LSLAAVALIKYVYRFGPREQPMIRRAIACSVICLLFVGCGRVAPPPHAFAKHELNGGRYFIDCEDTGGGSLLSFVRRLKEWL
jgi:hypothetical protein